MEPIIIVNFKTYEQSTGINGYKLARLHDEFARQTGASVMVAVQNADIYRISKEVGIPVLAQHVDPVTYGSNTGKDLPECIKEAGAYGTLINHSEDRIDLETIKKCIQRCREAGLKTVVCAESLTKAFEIAGMRPDYLAYEDPELIGTGKSVTTYNSDSVKKFGEMVEKANKGNGKEIVPLTGAGISNGQDVRKSMELGMHGVLLASGVVKSKKPKAVLKDLTGD